jgi:hypothetical protein
MKLQRAQMAELQQVPRQRVAAAQAVQPLVPVRQRSGLAGPAQQLALEQLPRASVQPERREPERVRPQPARP